MTEAKAFTIDLLSQMKSSNHNRTVGIHENLQEFLLNKSKSAAEEILSSMSGDADLGPGESKITRISDCLKNFPESPKSLPEEERGT